MREQMVPEVVCCSIFSNPTRPGPLDRSLTLSGWRSAPPQAGTPDSLSPLTPRPDVRTRWGEVSSVAEPKRHFTAVGGTPYEYLNTDTC